MDGEAQTNDPLSSLRVLPLVISIVHSGDFDFIRGVGGRFKAEIHTQTPGPQYGIPLNLSPRHPSFSLSLLVHRRAFKFVCGQVSS